MRRLIQDLPGILTGKKNSRFNLHKLFWGAIGYKLLESIHDAFEVKSYGLPDELGNEWVELTKEYKAYKRPISRGDLPQNVINRVSRTKKSDRLGLLTPGQYKAWKQIFGIIYHAYKDKMPDDAALKLAGQLAWTRMKNQGAITKIGTLGERDLLLLRITDNLYASLSPGKFNPESGYSKVSRKQIFIISRGKLTIGTNVPYANMVSAKRPIWPEDISRWLDEAVDFAMDAVMSKIQTVIA